MAQGNHAANLKVATIVGTRPELIRLSRVLAVLDRETDHCLIHTGQNYDYELNEIFFEDLGIRKPDHFLGAAGKSAAQTIGQIIMSVDEVFEAERPDAMLVLGDTNSCMSAYVAKRRRIPVFHMEAGNRCFDQRVPEEINRRVVDHVSDVNLTYSDIAREYLLREGIAPDRVIKTGSPMFEVLNHYREAIASSDVCARLGLEEQGYFLLSAHREENVDSPACLNRLLDVLDAVGDAYDLPIVFSTHPRTRARLEALGRSIHPRVQLMKPLGFFDFVHLELHAKATLSDSGTITEESSILNFPALNLREAHERPEGMEEASVMMVGLSAERVLQGLRMLDSQPRGDERVLRPVADYSMPNVSEKVLRIILSYVDYIQRNVWKEY